MTKNAAKVQPNASGVCWSPSKSGKIQIARKSTEVWAIDTGTHDIATGATRRCRTEDEAIEFANQLWRTR